jgi:hypothetical protein
MSVATPLLDTIEQDEPSNMFPSGNMSSTPKSAPRAPIVLTPTDRATATQSASMASTQNDAESGIAGIFRQSTHPVPLFFLFAFRIAALVVYILSSYLGDFVVSTVLVVVLLAMDFWNCRVSWAIHCLTVI